MRILIAHESVAGGGGVESYLVAIVPALIARGHEVAFLHHGSSAARGPTRLQFEGVPQLSVADEGLASVLQQVAAWRPDVCFSHNMSPLEVDQALLERWVVVKMMHGYFGTCISAQKAHSFPSVAPCSRVFGTNCVALYVPRGCGPLRPVKAAGSLRWNMRQRALLHRYAAVVVASRYMRREYVQHGVAPEKVVTAPLFPTIATPVGPRPRPVEPSVLFAGRMTELKGPHILIEAVGVAARALDRRLALVMAGEGPERARLAAAASASGVSASFPGWLTGAELVAAYRRASVIAVPSLWPEPFGLVGLEAALHGVPALAFDTGGISEWLQDGINGRVVREVGNPQALGHALAAVLGNPELLRTFEVGARDVASRMTLTNHLARLEETFERACASANPRTSQVAGALR